jgi:transcription termination factor Rho
MSAVLDRDELEQSPLADLHVIGNELGIDGFRRLRKADLIDAILDRSHPPGEEPAAKDDADDGDEEERPARARRSRGGRGRGRGRDLDEDAESSTSAAEQAAATADDDDDDRPSRSRRGRGGRGEGRDGGRDGRRGGDDQPAAEKNVEGTIELMANGSGFIRVNHPDTSDDDVYVSAAQVKRCELVTGDKVGGPLRAPRRSERFPSLVRVDTINGKPAEEVAGEGTKFEDLPATFATERFELGSDDPTVSAIEWLAPFGKGSRVSVVGRSQAGKSETLRRLATALNGREGLEVSVVLAGTRPEEAGDWSELAPAATVAFTASPDSQAQCVEQVVEQGRRVAARGGDAVVIIDSLEYVPAGAARRLIGAARNIADGGSLTIIAGAPAPVGGETTIVALDETLTRQRRFPAIDLTTSGTMRAELLVGEKGAEEIARKRAEVEAARA